jgi:hypothetical protein
MGIKLKTQAVVRAIIVLIFVGVAKISLAHTLTGSLGTAASATDWFYVVCPDSATVRMEVSIADLSPPDGSILVATVSKTGALTTTDNPEGGIQSPSVALANGIGLYNFFIRHTKATATANAYSVSYYCETPTHVTLPAQSPVYRQNQ